MRLELRVELDHREVVRTFVVRRGVKTMMKRQRRSKEKTGHLEGHHRNEEAGERVLKARVRDVFEPVDAWKRKRRRLGWLLPGDRRMVVGTNKGGKR